MGYPKVIANAFEDVRPATESLKHFFELMSENPMYHKTKRMAIYQNDTVRKEIDRMLAAAIFTPVESSWTSPVIIATKEEGSPRFFVDYRKLNSIMYVYCWPLPRVDKIVDNMKGSSVFKRIDHFQGYWQIEIDETCKKKAA